MALDDLALSLMTFPQRWHGGTGKLDVNVLLLPVGDPTAALGTGPAFAGTAVHLVARIVTGLDTLPTSTAAPALSVPFVATPPPVAPTLFAALRDQLVARGITVTSTKLDKTELPTERVHIHKALPASYTRAFAFDGPREDCKVGDEYCCALREQAPKKNNEGLPKPDKTIAWGQILSYALRQPLLAEYLGLVHRMTLDLPAGLLADGGYLYVALDASSLTNPWVSAFPGKPDSVRAYAARLPPLEAKDERVVFAATLFPVVAAPSAKLDVAQLEAQQYDDGFAQIVHSNQPETIDAVTLRTDQIAPGTEAGIQLGWDDEQVTVWLNRQLGLLHDRVKGTDAMPEAPLGVQGYRVDLRLKGDADWRSLCAVNGSLPFDKTTHGGAALTSINGSELWVTPVPVRAGSDNNRKNAEPAWLPLYFAQWAGSSLVLPDPVVQLLAYAVRTANTDDVKKPLPAPALPNPSPDLTTVPLLRYGNDYEFRVRLVDLTGGGPTSDDPIVHPGPAPTSLAAFRRFVPPKSLEIDATPPAPAPPEKPPAVRTITTLDARRPRISYPEAIFAGVDPATFSPAQLGPLIKDAWASNRPISVPDPDVDSFIVRVEARIPTHDTGIEGTARGQLDGDFRVLYSVRVPFAGAAADDETVTLTLVYTDGIDDIAKLAPPPSGTTNLVIPTARDVRVRLYPQCTARANYYAADEPPLGFSSDYIVRKDAAAEDQLFSHNPEVQLQAFYFQPGANIAQLLAQELDLAQQGLTLSGQVGRRTVFGASGALRHHSPGDLSAVTFSNRTELNGHWIVALVLELERDWTWDGFAMPALKFTRDGSDLGAITFPRVVAAAATGDGSRTPGRSRTRIVFLDAIDPHPKPGAFPDELHPHYAVTASFDVAPPQTFDFDIRLPITTPPAQVPKVVATGIAESDYRHFDNYSRTAPRERSLWIEFDEPIANTDDDAYFARVLAYGPDPLLAADLLPIRREDALLPEAIEPLLPIDPEPARKIHSGQGKDLSGLDAMTQLVPASGGPGKPGTFFLLPLPDDIKPEALELFGFWTYEFRVGHAKKWSTAQARYGRPLRVAGIQHPAPDLICAVERSQRQIGLTAPYATTVVNGKRVYDFRKGDPQTRMWFMLYAQVMQADGTSYRNVLIDHRLGFTLRDSDRQIVLNPQHASGREPRAGIVFAQQQIDERLALIGLPPTTGLSVLAVELLPGPLNVTLPEQPGVPGVNLTAAGAPVAGTFDAVRDGMRNVEQAEDALGRELGLRRILRTSPLTAVPSTC